MPHRQSLGHSPYSVKLTAFFSLLWNWMHYATQPAHSNNTLKEIHSSRKSPHFNVPSFLAEISPQTCLPAAFRKKKNSTLVSPINYMYTVLDEEDRREGIHNGHRRLEMNKCELSSDAAVSDPQMERMISRIFLDLDGYRRGCRTYFHAYQRSLLLTYNPTISRHSQSLFIYLYLMSSLNLLKSSEMKEREKCVGYIAPWNLTLSAPKVN